MELRAQGIHEGIIDPGAVSTGFANHEDELLEQYANQSELYREPIRRMIGWHKENSKGAITPERVVEILQQAIHSPRPRNR
jgi:hypothetical protein